MPRFVFPLIAAAILLSNAGHAAEPSVNDANGFGKFEFALIGDVPYGVAPAETYPPFDRVMAAINGSPRIKWVLHAGDIKAGGTNCSDELFLDRLQRFNQLERPVIYTPGDNEWTDCHRIAAGGYQPLERLARLREVFFATPGITIGGTTMAVESQSATPGFEEFPENVLWAAQRVVFAAIHVVGSNNGMNAFQEGSPAVRTEADDAEVERRLAAALAWLDRTFAEADTVGAPGVFVMIHGNPNLERSIPTADINPAFAPFLEALSGHVQAYGRPVVLAHGDSHYYRVDKPNLPAGGFLRNFTRAETFGSSRVHWVRVTVDPRSPGVFAFQEEIIPEN